MISKIIINPSYEWREDAKSLGVSHSELEVFALLADGHDNKEIAQILGIKYQTVKNHLYSLTKKLGANNVSQATIILQFKNMIRIEIPSFSDKYQITNENIVEIYKQFISDEDKAFSNREKKKMRKWLLDHGLYGQLFEDRANELKGEGNDQP
ncbi:helix-turn-helix transcriptional regulator [Chloroflexota bacterium]